MPFLTKEEEKTERERGKDETNSGKKDRQGLHRGATAKKLNGRKRGGIFYTCLSESITTAIHLWMTAKKCKEDPEGEHGRKRKTTGGQRKK